MTSIKLSSQLIFIHTLTPIIIKELKDHEFDKELKGHMRN